MASATRPIRGCTAEDPPKLRISAYDQDRQSHNGPYFKSDWLELVIKQARCRRFFHFVGIVTLHQIAIRSSNQCFEPPDPYRLNLRSPVQGRYEDVAERTPNEDVRSVYKTLTRTTGRVHINAGRII
ncbi:uncharacterized protein LOC122529270 [Frieseomelitta varia]|uniref:uncharacterized protein LOC122529270 n=1 Tax=Frieseomelitta varia TaxID=561572 RepID=UPI001CB68F12|nr:uncharacterized protein LOC122529270 [Frieseomelitta varia]